MNQQQPQSFTCENCGALYEVRFTEFANPVADYAECICCKETLAEWNSTSVPLYRLIRTPDGKTPPGKPMV
jgi:hypothetical protein